MSPLKPLLLGAVLALPGALAAPRPSWESNLVAAAAHHASRAAAGNATCPAPVTIRTTAAKASPFTVISQSDLDSIEDWLMARKELNLTSVTKPDLAMSDNYIFLIEELKPNKTDVLAWLDENKPMKRYARVVLSEGAREEPCVTDYFVGPIPISSETTMQRLDYWYNGPNGGSVLFNGGVIAGPRAAAIEATVAKTMSGIADVTQDIFNLTYYGINDNRTTFTFFPTNPTSRNGTESLVWTAWRRNGLAAYEQPTDLAIRWDFGGTDPSLYKLTMIHYDDKIYHSVDEFRAAWKDGKLVKGYISEDTAFILKDRTGPKRDLEDRMAPTIVEPSGKRYKVDTENAYIEYLGWKFYTRFDGDVGIQFYDVNFKDERILYELSLQDAIAQYSGTTPFHASTAFMDRHYGLGAQLRRLVPGYDCPYHATYWDAEFVLGTDAIKVNNTICIFETDIGVPITRHYEPTYIQATKGSKLVVRQVATVGNYDYLWDYGFYVDGTITVDAHASGYIQPTVYRPQDKGQWGPRVEESISGTLHTHVMNIKADFDLINTANSFLKTDIVVENMTFPWADPVDSDGTFEMMRYNFTTLQTESEGLLPGIVNGQTMYTIQNSDIKNKWDQPRGYRILPGLSNVGLTSKSNPFFRKSAQFAKQPFAVSRAKDTEIGSSAALNQNVPSAPLVEFWKFFEDNESMVQEDLVVWVNLGMQHYTRAEDMPNTLMTEAHSSIMFAPQNWGDTELTRDLQNTVIYNYEQGQTGTVQPETNGVEVPACFEIMPQDELVGVFEGVAVNAADGGEVPMCGGFCGSTTPKGSGGPQGAHS